MEPLGPGLGKAVVGDRMTRSGLGYGALSWGGRMEGMRGDLGGVLQGQGWRGNVSVSVSVSVDSVSRTRRRSRAGVTGWCGRDYGRALIC